MARDISAFLALCNFTRTCCCSSENPARASDDRKFRSDNWNKYKNR